MGGFFFSNVDANLAAEGGKYDRIVAFDWLGFGASSRPYCRAPRHRWWSRSENSPADFFTDSLEEWRVEMGLERFTLLGHSLGGYLSARYAMKHGDRLDGLILASPAGLMEAPASPQDGHISGAPPWWLSLVHTAWSANVTPGEIIRGLGRFRDGAATVENLVKRRFNDRWDARETKLISDYLWHITAQPPSGEYAMNSILKL